MSLNSSHKDYGKLRRYFTTVSHDTLDVPAVLSKFSSHGGSSYIDHEEKAGANPAIQTQVAEAQDELAAIKSKGTFAKLWRVVKWADSFGVEVRGIERVEPSAEREAGTHQQIADSGFLWLSANLTISTFSLGTLGSSIFDLGLIDSCLTILFFNLICTIPVAFFSTWGKSTGLRQMVLGRYSFGVIGIYFPVLLNCIACIGWSTVNTIIGASALKAVSSDSAKALPTAAGIVIIAMLTLVVALFGYRHVHMFERYASIPIAIIFLIMLGEAAPHFATSMGEAGSGEAASVLSFGAAVAGFALGWTSLAADYTVNFDSGASTWKVFLYTYGGLNLPLILIQSFGAAMMTTFKSKTTWGDLYENYGLGGLLAAPLSPLGGFGKFLLVIMALSIVANNIPNMYSFALTFQVFGRYAQAIPRLFLVFLGTGIYIVLAIVLAENFESTLNDLLVILSYWLAIYVVILIEEHFIFRGGSFSGYNLDAYNTTALLPKGYAAIGAVCFGIMGAVLGMAQLWYIGPIGKLIGPSGGFGGDIGFELSGAFAGITYPVFRYLERKYVGTGL